MKMGALVCAAALIAMAGCSASVDSASETPGCVVSGVRYAACDGESHDYAIRETATDGMIVCASDSPGPAGPECVQGTACEVFESDGSELQGECR